MFSQRISHLHPYVPGEQPSNRVYIKLNANENPFPPSPLVMRELASVDGPLLARYPDPDSHELKRAIATMLGGGITEDMIFVGNGSDEVLSFIFYTLFDGNVSEPLILPEHTYSFYPVYADYYGIALKKIPLNDDFTININTLISEPSCGIIFANPNAPTGIALSHAEIRTILSQSQGKAVVIDEAYIDFGGESALSLLNQYDNAVIVRTFSKSMGFAGMRLGFALAHPKVIRTLTTVKNSFNHFPVDVICQKLGIAACDDNSYYKEHCRIIATTRTWFTKELQSCAWKVLPSSANFVFAQKDGLSGESIYQVAKENGILIRHFNTKGIDNFVRITIGTAEQMKQLLDILKTL